jgi:hypothetical protein
LQSSAGRRGPVCFHAPDSKSGFPSIPSHRCQLRPIQLADAQGATTAHRQPRPITPALRGAGSCAGRLTNIDRRGEGGVSAALAETGQQPFLPSWFGVAFDGHQVEAKAAGGGPSCGHVAKLARWPQPVSGRRHAHPSHSRGQARVVLSIGGPGTNIGRGCNADRA